MSSKIKGMFTMGTITVRVRADPKEKRIWIRRLGIRHQICLRLGMLTSGRRIVELMRNTGWLWYRVVRMRIVVRTGERRAIK